MHSGKETPTVTPEQIAILKVFTKPNKNYAPVQPSVIMTTAGGAKEHGSSWASKLYSATDMKDLERCGLIEKFSGVFDGFWVLTDLGIACRRIA